MFEIIYRKQALKNLQDIFLFISEDSPEYAGKVIFEIKNTISNLSYFPYLGTKYNEELRMIVNSKYKYKIVYSIKNEKIYIIGVFKKQSIY